MPQKHYKARCHCGAVSYEVDLDLAEGTRRCNCTYCAKARSWFAFVPADRFALTSDPAAQTEYRWTPPGRSGPFLHHLFCKACGSRTYAWGEHASFGGRFHAINVALLEGVDVDELVAAPIVYQDGLHDHFDEAPADMRLL